MLANATADWQLAKVQHNGGWFLDGQAGDTKLGLSCIDHWLGISASQPHGLQFDLVHVNFGLHDLNNNGKEVPVADYEKNLASIFATLKTKLPKAKLIFSTTTPVPLGDGGGSRTEAHVQEYNAAALKALAPDIASGRVQINDLHGDIVSKCGAGYAKTGKCELQVPNGVHYEFAGRQYGALSVTRKILEVLWGLGLKKPLKPLKQLKTDDGALKPNILLVMCVRVTRLYAVIVWPSAGLIDVHVGL